METKDHLILAGRWLRDSGNDLTVGDKLAFALGNIMPDFNLFSYVKRENGRVILKGHHYPFLMPEVCRLFKRLQGESFGLRQYYELGQLMHYAADAFTCAHNRKFNGNMHQHMKYEARLHCFFKSGRPVRFTKRTNRRTGQDFLEDFSVLHEIYEMDAKLSPEQDYDFICQAASLAGNLAPDRSFLCGKYKKLLNSDG